MRQEKQPQIYTNHRGYVGIGPNAGRPLDGTFDGFEWQAWSGSVIAYGATKEHAIEHCRAKLATTQGPRPMSQSRTLKCGLADR